MGDEFLKSHFFGSSDRENGDMIIKNIKYFSYRFYLSIKFLGVLGQTKKSK